MKEYTRDNSKWIIWISCIALLLIGVGIFFYYTFFRQSKSELVSAIPTDALFIFEINDNSAFVKTLPTMESYFNEVFSIDALPAYETVRGKLPKDNYNLFVSGHQTNIGISILFNTRIEPSDFKKLLRALSIDPANYTTFDQYKIYTYGTNYKSLKFVYFNHILSISDNIDILQKAIVQHAHPRSLMANADFKQLYNLAEKNKKQNWLLINNPNFLEHLNTFFTGTLPTVLQDVKAEAEWSAFQLRISHNELFLSGYTIANFNNFKNLRKQKSKSSVPTHLLTQQTDWYYALQKNESSICTFMISPDSVTHYNLLVMSIDTIHGKNNPFGNEENAEQMRSNLPEGIYPVDSTLVLPHSKFDESKYLYFMEKSNAYVFAENKEALKAYDNTLNNDGDITTSRLFTFSQSNIASNNLFEYTFYRQNKSDRLFNCLSETGKKSTFCNDISIFSISCNEVNEQFATINIYLNFSKRQ